jgi:hypothetical protein
MHKMVAGLDISITLGMVENMSLKVMGYVSNVTICSPSLGGISLRCAG